MAIVATTVVVAALASSGIPAGAAGAKRTGRGSSETMFTIRAGSGILDKDNPSQVPISLTLAGVEPQVSWFRAGGDSGEVTTTQALAMIGFDTRPPDAVMSLATTDNEQNAIAVTLTAAVYDANAATLQLSARPLSGNDLDKGELARFRKQVDSSLPDTFGAVSLFIDNHDTLVSSAGTPLVGNFQMKGSFLVPSGATVTVKRKWDSFNNCVLQDGTEMSDQRSTWGFNDPDGNAYAEVDLTVTAVDGDSCDWERSAMHWAVSIKGRSGVADVSLKQAMAGSGWYTSCEGASTGIYCVPGKSQHRLPYVY